MEWKTAENLDQSEAPLVALLFMRKSSFRPNGICTDCRREKVDVDLTYGGYYETQPGE